MQYKPPEANLVWAVMEETVFEYVSFQIVWRTEDLSRTNSEYSVGASVDNQEFLLHSELVDTLVQLYSTYD